MLEGRNFSLFLESVPQSVDIHFSGFSEPYHNPSCTDFIELAVDRGHRVALFTTTDGMVESDISRIARLQLKRVVVHLPDAFSEMRLAVDEVLCKRIADIAAQLGDGVEFLTLGVPHPELAWINRGRHMVSRRIQDRAGNVAIEGRTVGSAYSSTEIRERLAGKPLRCRKDRMLSNVLLPNGDLVVCAMDYAIAHPIGNLARQSYKEIVAGHDFSSFLEKMTKNPSEIICSKCEYAFSGFYSDREVSGFKRIGLEIV